MVVSSEKFYLSWPLNSEVEFMKQKMEPVFRVVYTFVCFFFFYPIVIFPFKDHINFILNRNFLFLPICGLLFFLFILCPCVNLICQT